MKQSAWHFVLRLHRAMHAEKKFGKINWKIPGSKKEIDYKYGDTCLEIQGGVHWEALYGEKRYAEIVEADENKIAFVLDQLNLHVLEVIPPEKPAEQEELVKWVKAFLLAESFEEVESLNEVCSARKNGVRCSRMKGHGGGHHCVRVTA